MKITRSLLLLALAGMTFVSCKEATSNNEDTATVETMDENAVLATTSFTIEGMHCEVGCAKNVEKKLAKLDGVKEATIDFEGKKATVTFDTNKQSPEILVETVEKISKDYIISDVQTSDTQAYFLNGDKDKKKKKKKAEAADAEKSNTDEKKSCGSDGEKKGACCASKKASSM